MLVIHARIAVKDESEAADIQKDLDNIMIYRKGGVLSSAVADMTDDERETAIERGVIEPDALDILNTIDPSCGE